MQMFLQLPRDLALRVLRTLGLSMEVTPKKGPTVAFIFLRQDPILKFTSSTSDQHWREWPLLGVGHTAIYRKP